MRPVHWISLLRVFALVALAASAALYVDYTSPAAAFCSPGSGCAMVRASGFGYVPLGDRPVPVPVFGLIGFALLYAVTLLPQADLRRRLVPIVAIVGGLAGLTLFLIQAVKIKVFCKLCVIVDLSAIGAAVSGAIWPMSSRATDREGEPRGKSRRPATPELVKPWAWATLAIIAIAAPIVWSGIRPQPPVPPKVLELYQPGKINVVEFADFECPFCRMLHERLKALVRAHGERVHFVRLNLPLLSHEHAHDAARSGVCAALQGKGEQMADVLFKAEDLSPEANRRAALALGVDARSYDGCISDPETDKRIDSESQILRDAGFQGLPTTFVGNAQIVGAQSDDVFRAAFESAAHGDSNSGIPAPLFVGLVGVVAVVVVGMGRERGTRRR